MESLQLAQMLADLSSLTATVRGLSLGPPVPLVPLRARAAFVQLSRYRIWELTASSRITGTRCSGRAGERKQGDPEAGRAPGTHAEARRRRHEAHRVLDVA